MIDSFKIALRYFKYAAMLFLISYSIYIIYDDYVFIKKISSFSDFVSTLAVELWWLMSYFIGLSIYYWLIASAVILIYHKLYKPYRNK